MKALARLAATLAGCILASGPVGAEVFTGTYVGDGVTSRAITGVPFQPDILIIKGDDSSGPGDVTSAVLVTSTMPAGLAKPLKGTQALLPSLVQSLDPNGFTVGGARGTNQSGVQFYYTAFRADANTVVGTYTGNGSTQSLTGLGFTPDYMIVAAATSNEAVQRSYQDADSWPFWTSGPLTNAVTGLDADGFTVGSSLTANEASRTYHFVAWNEVAGKMRTGWYFGDGTNPHAVTDVGFSPQYLIVKAIDQNENPIQRFAPMTGDTSVNFMSTTVVNRIVAFEAEGFRVGGNNEVNRANDAYIYAAFGNAAKPPLTVTETSTRITVQSADNFEMSFDTAVGGSIQEFFDLASGENRSTDLAGGLAESNGLVLDSVNVSATWYNTTSNDTGAVLHLIEATPTRVKVRQNAFYQQEAGTVIQPGLRGVGDYAVYGTGKMALGWQRRASAVTSDGEEFGLAAHFETLAPLSNWQGYSESGLLPQAGSDDFVMMQIQDDFFGTYTDFLQILHRDLTEADTTEQFGSTPNEWLIGVWDNANPRSLPAIQEIDSLVYFKPTDFVDATDPKVLRRRNDYRSPDPLSIAVGGGWNENTADTDFFNESEAAYTLDMDPLSGLRFDMNGSVIGRLTPFFKIRQWRSLLDPPRVMLEGAVLVNDTHYQADVKPIARASMAENLLWHSTFENASAVSSPDVGGGGAIAGGTMFVPARYGNGALFDVPVKNITVPGLGNINTTVGTTAISMRPLYNHNDGLAHHFWSYYVDANNFITAQKRPDNFLELQIRVSGVNTTVQVDPTSYAWRAGDFVHISFRWDSSTVLGLQARIFINGIEPIHIDPVTPYGTPLPPAGTLYIGGDQSATLSADALIDELHFAENVQDLAHGGHGPDPFEYLGTGARNYTLTFAPVDGSHRGRYLYLGADTKFHGLNVALATAGIGAVDLHWEYRTPSGWVGLESVAGFVDETNHLTGNGSVYWAQDPPGWSPSGGEVDLYYVRVHLESGSYVTAPVEARITTDILLFQYCDNITAAAQTFDFDVAPDPDVSISSLADQTFTVGHLAPPVVAGAITITDVSGASITAGGDIRIRIPAGFRMQWDPKITGVALGGTAIGKVLPGVVYEDLNHTVVLNVVTDFAPGDQIIINNLELVSFTAPSPPDSFELEIDNTGSIAAVDDKLIAIVPNATPVLSSAYDQLFTVGQTPAPAATMYVTEGLTNFINTSNTIIIRIPAGFDMFWDTSITTAIIGGTGAANVSSAVSYEAGNRGVILTVTNNFAPGQYVSISGLGFTGFTTFELPANLALDVTTAVDTDDKTIAVDALAEVPFFTATAKDLQVALEWVTPDFGTCVDVRIARRLAADPTPSTFDWSVDVACTGPAVKHITTDTPPLNDQTYTYGAFVSDGAGGYSGGRLLKARPFSTSGRVKWAYSTAAASMAPPGLRFSGGVATVYAVSNDNILHAIQGSAAGGTWPVGWRPFRLGGAAQARPPVVPFAVGAASNGVAFLGAQDGKVYAINADDGSEEWSQNIATMVQASPAGNFSFYDAAAKDFVLVGTRNSSGPNALAALDVANGAPVWSFTNTAGQGGDGKDIGIISGSVAVDYATRRLFFASRQRVGGSANTIWCIDFDGGSPMIVWAKAIGDIDGSPVLWGGVVYVGTNAGSFHGLDATTGSNNWPPLALGDGAVKGFVFPQFGTDNRLLSTNTRVWSVADSGAARAVNPGWPVTAANVASPSIPTYVPGSSEVLVGSSDGNLYQLNVTAPVPTVSVTLGDGGGAVGVPTVDLLNSMIYVGTDQGVIYGVEFPLP